MASVAADTAGTARGLRPGREQTPGPIRVAQVALTSEGATWLVEISRGLRDRGYEVHAIVDDHAGELVEGLRRAGVPTHALTRPRMATSRIPARFGPLRLVPYAIEVVRLSLNLARLLRRERFDVLQSHIFISTLVARLGGLLAGVPVRISMFPGPLPLESPLLGTLNRITHRIDHRVVSSCDYTDDLCRRAGVPTERRARIYYGADHRVFDPARADGGRVRAELGIAPDAPVIGLIAHFYPPEDRPTTPAQLRNRGLKGHEYAIDALPIVREAHPDVRLLLAGRSWGARGEAYRRELAQRARDLGVGDRVLFLGPRPDVPDVLAAVDVAVQCSLSEALGGTIEALLMERPTVATRVGGMPEAIRHGETGLLVEPRDASGLAEAISSLLHDRDRARRLARAGRRLALSRLTAERTLSDLDALIRSAAREHAPAVAGRLP